MRVGGWIGLVVAAALAGCGGGGEGANGQGAANDAEAEGLGHMLNEAEGAALADEAAADEAADTDLYGGNAAAGETGNAVAGGTGNAAAGSSGYAQ